MTTTIIAGAQAKGTPLGGRRSLSLQSGSLVLALHMGFAIRVYLDVERHRVAADGAVLDVVLVRTPGDIHGHHDFFAAGVADIRRLKVGGPSSAAAFGAFLGHGTQKCSPLPRNGLYADSRPFYKKVQLTRGVTNSANRESFLP